MHILEADDSDSELLLQHALEPETEFEPLELEPDLELEPEPEPAPPRRHSPLARALAVAIDVEEACVVNDNEAGAPAPMAQVIPLPAKPEPTPSSHAAGADDEEPPFDAPDEDDDIFQSPLEEPQQARRWSDPEILELKTPLPTFPHEPAEDQPPARPAPAISIHLSWDRPGGSSLAEALAADPLLVRADVSDARGGAAGAISYLGKINPPDLLILDTTLKAGPLLEAVATLQAALSSRTKLFIIGEINDVSLLRELARRGVAQYFLAPAQAQEIARAICDLYADHDRSHVIAVVGSRGGAGASTIAHNLAWAIGERHDASTTLIELDLAFGATAFSFDQRPAHSLAEGMRDPDAIDESFLDRVSVQQTERLRVLAAPADLKDAQELHKPTIGALIRTARRTSSFVVMDVPHQWNACVKDVLDRANDVVIVATPDLASLRNAKAMMDVLKGRPADHQPQLILSMLGAAKGAEISERDFAAAVGATPTMALAFDPALFCGSALKRQMLGEMAPQSPAARQIDELAQLLTGLKPVKRKRRQRKPQDAPQPTTPAIEAAPAQEIVDPPEPSTEQLIAELLELEPAPAGPATLVQSAPRRARPRPLSRRQREPIPPRQRPQPGTLRLTAALMALIATSMWYVEKRTDISFVSYAVAAPR